MKTIVGFLSRPHGYDALSAIAKSQNYKIIKLYTHKLNPKSQDPQRSIRTDYELFVKKCADNSIPLVSIDTIDDEILALSIILLGILYLQEISKI